MKHLLLTATLLTAPLAAQDAPHPMPAADAALPEASLYALASTWVDQHEKPIVWSQSLGTTRVVALGYATCKGICPRIIADMQRIESGIPAGSKTRFTFITLDPKNDLQPRMKALEERHHLDPARWDLLRGSEDDLLELAVALGVRFDRLPNGVDFAHSYLIVVIGPDGRILHKWTDPKAGAERSIQAINAVER